MELVLDTLLGDGLTKATSILGGNAGEFITFGLALVVITVILGAAFMIISWVRARRG